MSSRITRRQFVVGASGLGVLAGCGRLPGQAQAPAQVRRIGLVLPYTADSAASLDVIKPFRAGLQDWGYVEGQNLLLEYRSRAVRTTGFQRSSPS